MEKKKPLLSVTFCILVATASSLRPLTVRALSPPFCTHPPRTLARVHQRVHKRTCERRAHARVIGHPSISCAPLRHSCGAKCASVPPSYASHWHARTEVVPTTRTGNASEASPHPVYRTAHSVPHLWRKGAQQCCAFCTAHGSAVGGGEGRDVAERALSPHSAGHLSRLSPLPSPLHTYTNTNTDCLRSLRIFPCPLPSRPLHR